MSTVQDYTKSFDSEDLESYGLVVSRARSVQITYQRGREDSYRPRLPDVKPQFVPTPSNASRRALGRSTAERLNALAAFAQANRYGFVRRTLYASLALVTLTIYFAALRSQLAPLFASSIFLVWGAASIFLYAATGSQLLNPRLGAVMFLGGFGTAVVAIVAIVL